MRMEIKVSFSYKNERKKRVAPHSLVLPPSSQSSLMPARRSRTPGHGHGCDVAKATRWRWSWSWRGRGDMAHVRLLCPVRLLGVRLFTPGFVYTSLSLAPWFVYACPPSRLPHGSRMPALPPYGLCTACLALALPLIDVCWACLLLVLWFACAGRASRMVMAAC
jgi:hypothetical protein